MDRLVGDSKVWSSLECFKNQSQALEASDRWEVNWMYFMDNQSP